MSSTLGKKRHENKGAVGWHILEDKQVDRWQGRWRKQEVGGLPGMSVRGRGDRGPVGGLRENTIFCS